MLQARDKVGFRDMSIIELYFGFHGRIGRKTFWLASLVPSIIQAIVWVGYKSLPIPSPVLAFVAGVAVFAMVMLNAKRLHDVGKSGWWQLISLLGIPLIIGAYLALFWNSPLVSLALSISAMVTSLAGLWIVIQMWFFQGASGDNDFGPAPTSKDLARSLELEISQLQPVTARLALANMPPPSGVIDRTSRGAARPSRNGGFGRRDSRIA